MGCSGSKTDDLPLVSRCRERRDLIRAAANHRYALAAAHVSYFRSLKDVGDALRSFIDDELVASPSPSPLSKLDSESHGCESVHLHDYHEDEREEESHLCITDSSTDDGSDPEDHRHHDNHVEKSPSNYSGSVYYMKKSAPPPLPTKTPAPPQPHRDLSDSYWNPTSGYVGDCAYYTIPPTKKTPPPPSPNSPAMEFLNRFNAFDVFDGEYVGLISTGDHENTFNSISPNSSKVKEKGGISKLGEETEHLACREPFKGKGVTKCTSKSVPLRNGEGSSRSVLSRGSEKRKKSPLALQRSVECVNQSISMKKKKKKGAYCELERKSSGNAGSSRLSSETVLSSGEERDLRDVVAEIRDNFEIASGYGKEVAMMLEAGKVPYRPSFLKGVALAVFMSSLFSLCWKLFCYAVSHFHLMNISLMNEVYLLLTRSRMAELIECDFRISATVRWLMVLNS